MDATADELGLNKTVVRAFFQALNDKGFPEAINGLPSECTWWAAGETRKQPEMAALTQEIKNVFAGPLKMEILSITAEGDRVAVEAKSQAPLKSGKEYKNTYVFLFRVRDGQVVEIREHSDTRRAAKAFQTQ